MSRMRGFICPMLLVAAVLCPRPARAVDQPVVGLKLILLDKIATDGKAKAVFVTKDPAVAKGSGTDATQIRGNLTVAFDAEKGTFGMPQGASWIVNKSTVAKYVNDPAPAGGSVRVGVVKPGTLVKVVAKSLGDSPIDISVAPSAAVYVVHDVINGAELRRHCTAFNGCVHKSIAAGTGWKVVCKGDSVGDPDCQATCFSDLGTTVRDTCTGLEWEKKETSVGGGVDPGNLHDVDNTYSWAGECSLSPGTLCQPTAAASATCTSQTGGALGCAECGVGEGTCNVDPLPAGAITTIWDWLEQVNGESFGGHTDWRLAVPSELQSIVDMTEGFCVGGTEGCIGVIFGPTVAAYYWTSTTAVAPDDAEVVNFSDGLVFDAGKPTPLWVRAVRPAP